MPPKAKRYRVYFHDPILNRWRLLNDVPMTEREATTLMDVIKFETMKVLVKDSE